MRARAAAREDRGQASIELLAAVPVLLLVALAAVHVLVAFACREAAAHGAHAGAVALLQGADPVRAARAALPGRWRASARISADGRRVVVRVSPPAIVPGVERLVSAESAADAGPAR